MAFIALVPTIYFNVKQYGAVGDGVTDDTSAIASAITAAQNAGGGTVFFPAGTYLVSSTLSLTANGVILAGSGAGTIIQPSASFPNASKVIFVNNVDYCGVRDMQFAYANTTSSANPTSDFINISQARYGIFSGLQFYYCGAWCISSIGSAGKSNLGTVIRDIHALHCQNGIHLQSKQANWPGQHFLENINLELIDAGDCLFLEDIDDIVVNNYLGAVNGSGSGIPLHIKGAGASNFFSNIDIGVFPNNPGTQPTVLIESSANGSPSNLTIQGGVIQQGSIGISITAGKQIIIEGFKIGGNAGSGISVSGTAQSVEIADNIFVGNGVTAGSGRYSIGNSSSNDVYIRGNIFQDNIGSSANQVNNIINSSAGTVTETNNSFTGTGLAYNNQVVLSGGTATAGRVVPHALYDGELSVGSLNVLTANTVYFVGVTLLDYAVLTSVRVRFGTGGTGHYDVGVYTDNAGVPGTLIDHAAATNTTLTDPVSASANPAFINGNMRLGPGRYWLAFWIDNATDQVLRQSASTGFAGPVRTLSSTGPCPSSGAGAANASVKVIMAGLISGNWS